MVDPVRSRVVNVIWRTILIHVQARLRARRGDTLPLNGVSRIRLTTLPTDIDILLHMNNGRYLSLFDLGRWDLLVRTGLWDVMRSHDWYAVVSAETITFRKSLQLWQRFDVESRMLAHDDRAVYMEHRVVVDGEVYTRAIIRSRLMRRSGGTLPHDELFAALGPVDGLPDAEPWVREWAQASRLPSTRKPAPSTWK